MEEILKVGKAIGFTYPYWFQCILMTITVVTQFLNWFENNKSIQKFRKKVRAQNNVIYKNKFIICISTTFIVIIIYSHFIAPFLVDSIYEQINSKNYKPNSPHRTQSDLFLSAFFIPLIVEYFLLFYYRKWDRITNTFIIFLLIPFNAISFWLVEQFFVWWYDGGYYWNKADEKLNIFLRVLDMD